MFLPLLELNQSLFLLINRCGAGVFEVRFARLLAELPVYFCALLLGLAWLRAHPTQRREALRIPIAAITVFLINSVIRHYWYYPRPFVLQLGCTFLAHSPNSSFPSNHVALLLACASTAFFIKGFGRVACLILALAVVLAWARVFVGVHWPLDMLGAVLTGLCATLLSFAFLRIFNRLRGTALS